MRRALPLIVLLCGACDDCTDPEVCDADAPAIDVGGVWTIEGEGERAGCDDPRYNGAFELGSVKLAIVSVAPAPKGDDDGGGEADGGGADGGGAADGGDVADGGGEADGPTMKDAAGDGPARDLGPVSDAPPPPGDAGGADTVQAGGPDAGQGIVDSAVMELSTYPDLMTHDASPLDSATTDALVTDASFDAQPPDAQVPDWRRYPDLVPPEGWNEQEIRATNTPRGFTLHGSARGTCIDFETREETLGAGTLLYLFSGTIKESGTERTISGSFTGTGPAGCTVSGDFEVSIR